MALDNWFLTRFVSEDALQKLAEDIQQVDNWIRKTNPKATRADFAEYVFRYIADNRGLDRNALQIGYVIGILMIEAMPIIQAINEFAKMQFNIGYNQALRGNQAIAKDVLEENVKMLRSWGSEQGLNNEKIEELVKVLVGGDSNEQSRDGDSGSAGPKT